MSSDLVKRLRGMGDYCRGPIAGLPDTEMRGAADLLTDAADTIERLTEQLRRAQLLTPDAVKATCGREGARRGYWNNRKDKSCWQTRHFYVRIEGNTFFVTSPNGPGPATFGRYCYTIGQLEDAIRDAKEKKHD